MKIFIKYENNKKILLNISNFQSIHSIIYQYLEKIDRSNDLLDDYFLDYNGIYLNKDYSLEKYGIIDGTELNLNKKKKGGNFNEFFNFAMKNPIIVIIVFIIVYIPIILLPIGFLPALSALIKSILGKGLDALSTYLVCKLGKTTIVKRLNMFLNFFKYFVFILMVYVIITFPLILLCITLKGHSVKDDPLKMCSPLKAGSLAGVILTSVFFIIYISHRGFNYVLSPIIYIFKQFFITNTILVPILEAIEKIFNKIKYIPIRFIPFIGSGIGAYIDFLEPLVGILKELFSNITMVGCKAKLNLDFLKKIKPPNPCDLLKKCASGKYKEEEGQHDKKGDNNNKNNNYIEPNIMSSNIDYYLFKKEPIPLCKIDKDKCCNPENFLTIADQLFNVLNNNFISGLLQNAGIFTHYLLFTECLFDEARYGLSKDLDDLYTEENIIKEKPRIEKKLFEIDKKIEVINDLGVDYAEKTESNYVRGNSIFKTIFKDLFLNAFCNILSTSKSSLDIIVQLGDIKDFADMLKSGASTGVMVGIMYVITFIVLLICGLCGVF